MRLGLGQKASSQRIASCRPIIDKPFSYFSWKIGGFHLLPAEKGRLNNFQLDLFLPFSEVGVSLHSTPTCWLTAIAYAIEYQLKPINLSKKQ
jgi:hypothetical protein